MHTLDKIPFTIDADRIMAQAHVKAGSADAAELLSLIELARETGRPKAYYAESFVTGRDGDEVQIDDVRFTSRTLAHHLEKVERVFPIVATCGVELDDVFPAKGDIVKEFWWDLIKTRFLTTANKYLRNHLQHRFRLSKMASMHPGSGDMQIWPIEQQKPLFSLLNGVESAIGVQLTDSCLMIPDKTISGLVFPTEADFRSCEVCHREHCPARRAPFNKELWEEIQHN